VGKWLHAWPKRDPQVDERTIGIGFVDVLFGLVIGAVLQPFADVGKVPTVGRVQLILAGVITVTSWIGYHNSWNRPRYFILFPNLPLFQFLIDVILVIVYFLIAITAPGATPGVSREASVVIVAILVAISFVLYAMWDRLAFLMRKDDRYKRRSLGNDVPVRRQVSYALALVTVVIAGIVGIWRPTATHEILAIEALLITLAVGYRFLKEYVTPVSARVSEDDDASVVSP
jgi:hypothetical protein